MGARGPAPKPTKLKIKAGNPGRRPLNDAEPQPEVSAGSPPDWLDDDARQIWFQLAPPMTGCGLVTRVDELALGRYVQLLAMWIRACTSIKQVKATAYPVKNKAGKVVGHRELPAFAELRRLGPQLTQLEREFGMTPSSRTRIRLQRDDRMKENPDEAAETFWLKRPEPRPVA